MSALLVQIDESYEYADLVAGGIVTAKVTDAQRVQAVRDVLADVDRHTVECSSAGPNAIYALIPGVGREVKIGTWTWVR